MCDEPFEGAGDHADESRGLLHVTTCADELGDYFWYRYDTTTAQFEGLPTGHLNAKICESIFARTLSVTVAQLLFRDEPQFLLDEIHVKNRGILVFGFVIP